MKPMYRLPKDPGHIGGYYLAPTIAGLICLLISNALATQYVANHFEYQDALGQPLWHVGMVGVYQPFAWVTWVWRYGSSADPTIRSPLLLGAFIVIAGTFATGVLFFLLNINHTRRLSKNTEDLHGSARWATKADIEATGLLDAKQGVYVGGWYDERTRHLRYLRHNGLRTYWPSRLPVQERVLVSSFRVCSRGARARSSTTSREKTGQRPLDSERILVTSV